MLTQLRIQNFKLFDDVTIELGQTVVFIGPNNSGKTTALQALALWYTGLQRWLKTRFPEDFESTNTEKGFRLRSLNRLALTAIQVPETQMLWRDLRLHNGDSIPVRIDVAGIEGSNAWSYGLNFWYENEESLSVSPVQAADSGLFNVLSNVQLAFLPPMSGLVAAEDRLERGSIQSRIREGRTAEILRNLCYRLHEDDKQSGLWTRLAEHIRVMFAVELLEPIYIEYNSTIQLRYRQRNGVILDLSASGRGMLQILLLLAYMYTNPGAVLLLDEPDAHLEILRQRQIYQLLTDVARSQGSQIIAASHSEVLLNEAADRDIVIAFVGKPHRIDDRGTSQVIKSLKQIGFEHYYQAEQKGWVIYLEGATDLAILRAFAKTLEHVATGILEQPFVHYVANQPSKARDHFYGVREAKADLVGLALFDRLDMTLPERPAPLREVMWTRREIENYLALPVALEAYAADQFSEAGMITMREMIADFVPPIALRDPNDAWWRNTKASDEFLDRLFEAFFTRLSLPNLLRKTDYHQLAAYVPRELIDTEVVEKLDAIVAVASNAKPRKD